MDLLNATDGILSFVRNIPNMLIQCIGNFPPALVTLLIAGLAIVIAVRLVELLH